MNKTLRKAVIAGNWKMNKTPAETTVLINEIAPLVKDADCDVLVCVPYVDLQNALEATKDTNIKVGAENCHWAKSGAFTAEVSAEMLTSMGVQYVIIGHSERRQYFGETDAIVCVGETLDQREAGVTESLVREQTTKALEGVSAEELDRIIIAYEPVWAIGTGKTATAAQANEVCKIIRDLIGELYSAEAADKMVIQYGGSMNDGNAVELLDQPDVDGGLIGGASLVATKFAAIVAAASR